VDSDGVAGNHGGAMRLRVVPAPTGVGCPGCSRRAVLRGLAVTAAGALVGCPGPSDDAIDPPDAGPGSTASPCGNNLCLDLNDPRNVALTAVDGTLLVKAPRDTLIAVRTSPTLIQAVSDVCTHAGCGVRYDHVNKILFCPCHGSRFALSGEVLQGPAFRPLARYQTQLDQAANQLTIVL
jgi:cytochrome b6-f complex iron-sulfur subunit